MVSVTKLNEKITFNILGFHKFWALNSKITINQNDIIRVYQDRDEMDKNKGWRLGTEIPFVIIAGEFTQNGVKDFWDVSNKNKSIIVELKNHTYRKLYLQVENPEAMIDLLK